MSENEKIEEQQPMDEAEDTAVEAATTTDIDLGKIQKQRDVEEEENKADSTQQQQRISERTGRAVRRYKKRKARIVARQEPLQEFTDRQKIRHRQMRESGDSSSSDEDNTREVAWRPSFPLVAGGVAAIAAGYVAYTGDIGSWTSGAKAAIIHKNPMMQPQAPTKQPAAEEYPEEQPAW